MAMALPAGEVACSRETQVTIATCHMGTQCALRSFCAVGSQTEVVFPGVASSLPCLTSAERPVDPALVGASSGRLPASQGAVYSPVLVPLEQPGNLHSSYLSCVGLNLFSWGPDPGVPCARGTSHDHELSWKTANDHEKIQTEEQLCAVQFCDDQGNTSVRHGPCSVCKKYFSRKRDLLSHIRMHTGETAYVCSFCGKSFSRKSRLVEHERSHTGEKPYVCSICQKGFLAKYRLIEHERSHTGERPCVCSVCQKSFATKGTLRIHERFHGTKLHACQVCQKSFTLKAHLVNHEVLHTGERPYVCNICHKRFAQKGNLSKHARLHRGEKPYVCSICEKRFTQKAHLVKHTERVHSSEKPLDGQVF